MHTKVGHNCSLLPNTQWYYSSSSILGKGQRYTSGQMSCMGTIPLRLNFANCDEHQESCGSFDQIGEHYRNLGCLEGLGQLRPVI